MDGPCKNCRELENQFILQGSILEGIEDILAGREVSDFVMSFPLVRWVYDLVKEGGK